ncbi:hypothetical protein [Flavobacterium lipolyticum]|uniref:Transcriptional regulator n=1 Tax=Flavobacterium lipolyticum TaxID=2893754 RepID=A0ABS8M4Q6_9FLAO|nr:hypothetical protein [Flavobacterium sp. F-126]MCC9019795.1 hypothetical protein [Flavobacterium sp. F-126]
MNWKAIKTEEEHVKAVKRMIEIFHAEPNTPEDDELKILCLLVKDYEDKKHPMPELNALDEAFDDVANGRVHSHEQAMAKIKSRFSKHFK